MIRHFAIIAAALYVPTLALLLVADLHADGDALSVAELRQVAGSNPQAQRELMEEPLSCEQYAIRFIEEAKGGIPRAQCSSMNGFKKCVYCTTNYIWYWELQQATGNGGDQELFQPCGVLKLGTCRPNNSGGWSCVINSANSNCFDLFIPTRQ